MKGRHLHSATEQPVVRAFLIGWNWKPNRYNCYYIVKRTDKQVHVLVTKLSSYYFHQLPSTRIL